MLVAIILSSCARDIIDNDDENGKPKPGGTGNNISLVLKIPFKKGSTNRSYNGLDDGTIGEILINGVRVVLYGTDGVAKHCWDFDINVGYNTSTSSHTATGNDVFGFIYNSSEQSYYVQMKAKTASMADYYMLIIVNPNNTIKNITNEGDLANKLKIPFNTMEPNSLYQIANGIPGLDNGEPTHFLMLNSQELIDIKTTNFWETPEEAEDNPVYGSVERVATKITCEHVGSTTRSNNTETGRFIMLLDYNTPKWSNDFDIPDRFVQCTFGGLSGPLRCPGIYNPVTHECSVSPYHKYPASALGIVYDIVKYVVATDFIWQVDVVNKKSYWYRQLTYKAGGTELEKPGDTDRQYFYAKDPNFSNFSGTAGLSDEFSYITTDDIVYTDGTGISPRKVTPASYIYSGYWSWSKGDSIPVYIAENTMDQNDQRGDVVTRVVIKATLKRERFDTPDNTFPIGDFFVFKGGGTVSENINYNYNTNHRNEGFYILSPDDVARYQASNQITDTPVDLRPNFSILDAINEFNSANPGFNWDDISANTKPAMSEHLIFYKNSEIYFEIPIEHFTISEEVSTGEYGRFGVVRNNWYQLNIEDIQSLGMPTIPSRSTDLIETTTREAKSRATYSGNSNILSRKLPIVF